MNNLVKLILEIDPKSKYQPLRKTIIKYCYENPTKISLRKVAQACDVAPPSLYYYWPSKAKIMDMVFNYMFVQIINNDGMSNDEIKQSMFEYCSKHITLFIFLYFNCETKTSIAKATLNQYKDDLFIDEISKLLLMYKETHKTS